MHDCLHYEFLSAPMHIAEVESMFFINIFEPFMNVIWAGVWPRMRYSITANFDGSSKEKAIVIAAKIGVCI